MQQSYLTVESTNSREESFIVNLDGEALPSNWLPPFLGVFAFEKEDTCGL